jgi:hypothetical protein
VNPEHAKVENHGYGEQEELYHEKVKILDRFRELIWRDKRVEMKA